MHRIVCRVIACPPLVFNVKPVVYLDPMHRTILSVDKSEIRHHYTNGL